LGKRKEDTLLKGRILQEFTDNADTQRLKERRERRERMQTMTNIDRKKKRKKPPFIFPSEIVAGK
jgi:hypothetical protein